MTNELRRIAWACGSDADDDVDDDVRHGDVDYHIAQLDGIHDALSAIREQLREFGPAHELGGDDLTATDDAAAALRADRGQTMVRLRAMVGCIDIAIRNAIADLRMTRTKTNIDIGGIDLQLAEVAEHVEQQLDKAAAAARNFHEKGWREWILANIHSGARNAHRFLRLPEEWQPTTVIDPDGVLTAAPYGYRRWARGQVRPSVERRRRGPSDGRGRDAVARRPPLTVATALAAGPQGRGANLLCRDRCGF